MLVCRFRFVLVTFFEVILLFHHILAANKQTGNQRLEYDAKCGPALLIQEPVHDVRAHSGCKRVEVHHGNVRVNGPRTTHLTEYIFVSFFDI